MIQKTSTSAKTHPSVSYRSYPSFSTQSVHAGEPHVNPYHSVPTPIVQSATYTFPNTDALIHFMEARETLPPSFREYGRYGNPTVRVAEEKLAALERGEDALLFSSGMAAITLTLMTLLQPGDHLILTLDTYRRTRAFCMTFLRRWGVDVTVVNPAAYDDLEHAITPRTRYLFSETPTNPFLRVLDLERVVEIARQHHVRVIIDSTFATPYNLQPLTFGVDLVVHSVTKYLSGHNDLLAGVVIGNRETISLLREAQGTFGALVDPGAAYLIVRGLKTLALRVERQNANAWILAQYLEEHPKVRRVWYPGLPSHPDHDVAVRQMRGFGGVVSFEIAGTAEDARSFVDALTIPRLATSLGGVESLVTIPAIMSYYDASPEEKKAAGITDQLVRLSAGIEDVDDLLADVEQALAVVRG